MANIVAKSTISIELEGDDEITAFATLIADVVNAYDPPDTVGFKMKPKFTVPESVGDLCMRFYFQLGMGGGNENEELVEQNVENYGD